MEVVVCIYVCLRQRHPSTFKHNKHDIPGGTTDIPDTRLRPKQMGGLFAWDARNEDHRISLPLQSPKDHNQVIDA
jgi:hypothetical protein